FSRGRTLGSAPLWLKTAKSPFPQGRAPLSCFPGRLSARWGLAPFIALALLAKGPRHAVTVSNFLSILRTQPIVAQLRSQPQRDSFFSQPNCRATRTRGR